MASASIWRFPLNTPETADPIHALRVLVVDDETENHLEADRQLDDVARAGKVVLYHALNARQANAVFKERYIDLVLLDIFGRDRTSLGLNVLGLMSAEEIGADVILMSHLGPEIPFSDLISRVARSSRPRVVDFIDKVHARYLFRDALQSYLEKRAQVSIAGGLEDISSRVVRKGVSVPFLRSSHAELEATVCIDRLLSKILRPQAAQQSAETHLRGVLEHLSRPELGSSITAILKLQLGLLNSDLGSSTQSLPNSSQSCLVKFGPAEDIRAEARRYEQYVKFGVRIEQRVELVGHAAYGGLGLIVYGLSGGSRGYVASLGEALEGGSEVAFKVIESLFRTSWWSEVDMGYRPPKLFFDRTYGLDVKEIFKSSCNSVRAAAHHFGLEASHQPDRPRVDLFSEQLSLPPVSLFGEARVARSRPWVLVHGDMHGGNVLYEVDDDDRFLRTSLIDYRFAGPGPRFLDASALECAIRIADAKSARAETFGSSAAVADWLTRRLAAERRLLDEEPPDREVWERLSASVVAGASSQPTTGGPFDIEEYVVTCLLNGFRQMGLPLDPFSRLRLLVWLTALAERIR